MTDSAESSAKRRPQDDDLAPLMDLVSEGKSLRAACRELGLDPPSTHTWIDQDEGRRQQYARAKEQRAEVHQEQMIAVGYAAATGQKVDLDGKQHAVDPAGARVLLEALKWSTARMAPKTAPVQRFDITSRTRQMTDDEIAAEIAALEAGQAGDA